MASPRRFLLVMWDGGGTVPPELGVAPGARHRHARLGAEEREVKSTNNVAVVPSAPHSAVLREASLLVTHCGHGTTMKGLAAGVPLLCMPMGRDQNDIAQRVVHRGAGLRLKPTAKVAAIRAAAETLLKDARYKEGARALGRAIRDGEGCVDIASALEGMSRGEASRTRLHRGDRATSIQR